MVVETLAQSGSLRATEVLVRRGAAIDKTYKYGYTAKLDAASKDEVEVVHFLVENGADVKVSSSYKLPSYC
jgi:ankyrin repeat protein